MRKVLTLALCVALCLCMTFPTFAAGTAAGDYTGGSQGQDVKITIGGEVVHVYLVDIEFTAPTFTYASDAFTWNPDSYEYEHDANAAWNGQGTVKITNHSDLSVNYSVGKANVVDTYGDLDIVLAGDTKGTIAACTPGMTRGSQNATATYTVAGTPTVSQITAQTLGEIKVTISK